MKVFARHSNRNTGWFFRNRWGLGLLPLATVLAMGASSDRVKTYFWDADLHQPIVVGQGEWVEYSEPYELDDGEGTMTVQARLDGVRELGAEEARGEFDYQMPANSVAVEATLSFRADPDTPLRGCQIQARDQAGTRYAYQLLLVAGGQSTYACVPDESPGPSTLFGKLEMPGPDEPERPAEYTIKRVWVVPEGTGITQVDLWWTPPDYLSFRTAG